CYYQYLCICVCGKKFIALRHQIIGSRKRKSCGCINKAWSMKSSMTHGMSKSSIYSRWSAMFDRCYNKKSKKYLTYGARGISVSDKWNKFENFFDDMGHPPFKGATLDRINTNGNYGPGNV